MQTCRTSPLFPPCACRLLVCTASFNNATGVRRCRARDGEMQTLSRRPRFSPGICPTVSAFRPYASFAATAVMDFADCRGSLQLDGGRYMLPALRDPRQEHPPE